MSCEGGQGCKHRPQARLGLAIKPCVTPLRSAQAAKLDELQALAGDEAAASALVRQLQAEQGSEAEGAARLQEAAAAATAAAAYAEARAAALELQQRQAAARLESLRQESVRHGAAVEETTRRQQEAQAELDLLRSSAARKQEAAGAAEQAAQAAAEQHALAQAAAAELRSTLASLDGQLQRRTNHSNGRTSVDMAVAALASASAAWRLPAAFHGRLHSVARLSHEAAGQAVNAVLMETLNLARRGRAGRTGG